MWQYARPMCSIDQGDSYPLSIYIYISSAAVCKAYVLNSLGGLFSFHIYIDKQCSGMQGLCAQLTGGFISFLYIYICSVAVC